MTRQTLSFLLLAVGVVATVGGAAALWGWAAAVLTAGLVLTAVGLLAVNVEPR